MDVHRGARRTVERTGASRPKLGQIDARVADNERSMRGVLTEALHKSEVGYRLLAESLTDVIWITDLNLNLTYVSPSTTRMVGYSVEEALAFSMEQLLTPASFKVATKTLAEELAIENTEEKDLSRSRTLELEINCKDGSTARTEAKITFLRDSDTQPIGIVAVLHDITERERMEEELGQSEEKLRYMFESIRDGIVITDLAGNVLEVNQATLRMSGYTKEELIGRSAAEFITERDRARLSRDMTRELAEGTGAAIEYTFLHKDGTEYYGEVSGALLRDSSGNPTGFIGVLRDITDRKRVEEALRESEEKYRNVVESISDLIFTADVDGNVLFANPLAKDFTGFEPEETIGHNFIEYVHPDDVPSLFAGIQQVLSGESIESIKGVDEDLEFRMVKRDGEVIWVTGRSHPNTDREGKIVSFSGVLRDITERKRVEVKLRELSTAVEQSTDGIAIGDLEPQLTYVNSAFARMHGYSPNEMIGMKAAYLHNEEQMDEFNTAIDQIKTQGSWIGEIGHIRRDGTAFPTYMSVTLLKDNSGKPIGILACTRDITERKHAEEEKERITAQLLQAQKMEAIGILAGGIAHDFNNLITAIQGYANIAVTEVDETNPLYRHLKGIDAACSRAARLTRQLLLFGRKDSVEVTPLNINGIVEDLQKMLKRLIDEHIAIDTYLEPDIFAVQADPGSIEQVIMNLAVNARDAMPDGGRLTITTENVTLSKEQCRAIPEARPGRYVCLSVADTGVGMDEEIIQYISEPFFTTKEPGEGTGLGLSVVYGIAKQHEGWIDVYSEPGQGSTFKLYLPAVPPKPEAETKETILVHQLRGNGERILLVEDEERVRDFLADVLSEKGHAVFEAASAKEALDIFDSEKGDFHLVFSDVLLPDMSGFELVDQLLSRKPELPILLGSGWVDNELKWPTIREKEFQLLQKPYDLAELLQAVREAMGTCL